MKSQVIKWFGAVVTLLATLGGSGMTWAADETASAEPPADLRPYVSLMYGHVFEDSDRFGVDAGHGAQLSYGRAINRYWGWELGGFYTAFASDDTPGAQSQREYGAKLDGLYFYTRNPSFAPYFALGAGGIVTELRGSGDDSTDPFADVGLGFFKRFSVAGRDLALRADLRYRHIFFGSEGFAGVADDDLGEAVLKVGLSMPFGARPAAPPSGAACADADRDGVCDANDRCPRTAGGMAVGEDGCASVADAESGTRRFDDVHFAFDIAALDSSEQARLAATAAAIKTLIERYPALQVDVSGHTDAMGTQAYNLSLSERRAAAVRQYLAGQGIDAQRVNLFSFGESRPIATNDTEEGRALNRRAEIQTHE